MQEFYERRDGWKYVLEKHAILLATLFALGVFIYVFSQGWGREVNNRIDQMTTITGNFSCLPLASGEEDPEGCELGLRSRDGRYYALDVSTIQDVDTNIAAEDNIAVTGVVQPPEEISTSKWQGYGVSNIILVNTLLKTRN